MRQRLLISFVLLILLPVQASAATNEPVRSLRVIDKQLSTIDVQMEHLRAAATRGERSREIRRIRAAVLQIRRRAARLSASYRARHQQFGVKMFGELERKSLAFSRSLNALNRPRSKEDRKRLIDHCTEENLAVVLQYQAITSNLAANHCQARQWACCEPKPNPETNRGPGVGCRWACVSRPSACGGFIGPETPPGMASPPPR
jgi:hypothetical protein